ncbi:hypothetical protein INS49_014729 [Diaporthe citri]|uniref:uncharacterized protein n=1 Tax=Diaporthe citri TaxID=83186 RepID=UPI001C81A9AC|nr:uncharacterized protein INS49_014729 [Diaporthe citri]KAG6356855.1 hypothetical protein INS49_014729 [Diaporthe citri]
MVGSTDVERLLSTGTWTQRAKNPGLSNPVRANQSSKLEPLNPKGPRSYRSSTFLARRVPFPPPPSVEDEAASIAKEQGSSVVGVIDEEPKCRGDVEQNPIILPVPEFNPERRYVLVTPSETDDACLSDTAAEERPVSTPRTEYSANTKIPLDRKADEARGSAKTYPLCYGCTKGVEKDGRAKQLLQDRAVRPGEEERPAIPNSGPASIATKIDPQRPFSGEIAYATAKAEPTEIQLQQPPVCASGG